MGPLANSHEPQWPLAARQHSVSLAQKHEFVAWAWRLPLTGIWGVFRFCTEVNLTEIHIVTGDSNLAPEKMQLYADDRHLTKADVDAGQPTETFTLRKTKRVQVLKLTASKFRNVRVLSIYFPVHSSQSQENIWMIYLSPEGRPANPNACPAPPPTTHDYGADY